ncbi:MAG TPA: transposase, partial [Tepidisphaeraceae bacterium]|nr:transposase [Tepidisphaeraceae bacterium]
ITIDTSRVALSIARQRLLTAKFDYYKTRSSGVHAAVSSDFRGSGVLAASSAFRASESSGEDAASTFLFGAFDPEQPVGHIRGGNLPHWRQEGVTYFVTWRTADSMPKERVEQWTRERVQWLQQNPSPWTDAQRQDYARRFTARWERWLDECHGECLLREPKLKKLVEDALRHFDSQRYSLGEFVVMPNHVHVLVTPLAGHELSEIIGAWKSYTAHAINRELGRTGEFWQKESFDHIVRSAEAAERFGRYIRENPRRSGVLAAVSEGGKTQTSGGDAASTNGNPSKGFIYKTVPHITLKSIAQNVALDPIFVKHEPILEAKLKTANAALAKVSNDLRHKLEAKLLKKQREEGKKSITDADRRRWLLPPDNRVRSAEAKQRTTIDLDAKQWYAWEVPFDTDPDWPQALQDAVREYRQAWRAKMDEVNACIAASAEQEELVDQPEVVRGVTRVSGPFTVEAVQPPEMSLGDVIGGSDVPVALETFGSGGDAASTFTIRPVVGGVGQTPQDIEAYLDKMIRLLKLDGVRFPNNRQMTFSRLDPIYASGQGQGMFHAEGRWVNAGETDADPNSGATVGVVIGPQYGPVTAAMVDNLIKPASRRYDDLVVAAFSFDAEAVAILTEDPHLKLRLHMAHIRPDVNPAMEGLLKDSPGGQLFTVFGLPRINVSPPDADGMYRVTMEGVDIYDPVNNTIQSSGADKVAAWFLDSDYDGRTFCVTQAFFPDRSAWDKLARALGDAIDPERFEALSGTTSLPFAAGKHRRIAVKVIDPRGNEVMAVQAVGE